MLLCPKDRRMEPFVELQELVTVGDEEMDFTPVEEEKLNSAQRYRGVDRKMENCGSFVLWAVWTVPDPPSLEAVILALSISVYAAPREEKQVCDLDQGSGTKKSHSPCTYRTGRGPSKNDPECTMLKLRAEKTQI
ncbi:uncharacterized protein [Manis javanica]|uniref:uncharacterized protein isoform X3 n=1 Tax=Manis javanica TaxID=9974 RepID=UPI003C6D4E09